MSHEDKQAVYNIYDDLLRLYCPDRLPEEEYRKLREARWWWNGRLECFEAKWSSHNEDLLLEMYQIDQDHIEAIEEDDYPESRMERFKGYADNAARRSDEAQAGVYRIADQIPFGQPILVGHHSERHARADQNRIERGMRKTVEEWKKAEYWKRRAAGAEWRAARRERPAVIYRKVQEVAAVVRGYERATDKTRWAAQNMELFDPNKDKHWFVRVYGTDDTEVMWQRHLAYAQRNLTHFRMLLTYHQARYDAVKPAELEFEAGGAVFYARRWYKVKSVNKKTVTVFDWFGNGTQLTGKIGKERIEQSISKADYEAMVARVEAKQGETDGNDPNP